MVQFYFAVSCDVICDDINGIEKQENRKKNWDSE